MRIITGVARGKPLETLEGQAVRPTTQRVKESLFNILQFQLEGRRFLDLFCGSGQIGLEAASRGAVTATLVDSAATSLAVAKRNTEKCGLGKTVHLVQSSFDSFLLTTKDTYDVAYLDPPYPLHALPKALELLIPHMPKGGTVVCEHPVEETLPETVGDFVRGRQYRYGKIMLTVYQHKDVSR